MTDTAIILILTLMAGGTVALLCIALLYHPDRTAVRGEVRDMYQERDRESFFSSLMKERQNGSRAKGIKVSKKFEQDFDTAGLSITASEFLMIWAACILLPVIIGYAATGNTIVAGGCAAAGVLLPFLYFKKKQIDRREAFSKQIADVLLTICNGLHSGFSFQQSLGSIARDMQPPVSEEFALALSEMDYGVSQHDALIHMYERTKCEDLKMLVSALDITNRTGGNLSDVLETISETVRMRIKIRQEVKTLSAQGKTSALIIGLLPVFIIIILSILNPDYVGQLVYTDIGQKMLLVAAVMECIGFVVMNKITDVRL